MRLIHTTIRPLGTTFGRSELDVPAARADVRFNALGKGRRYLHRACYCRVIHPRFSAKMRPGPCTAAKRRPAINVK